MTRLKYGLAISQIMAFLCSTHAFKKMRHIINEVKIMAKKGMRRPDPREPHGTESNSITHFPRNTVTPVPEIKGKAKAGHEKANPPPPPT